MDFIEKKILKKFPPLICCAGELSHHLRVLGFFITDKSLYNLYILLIPIFYFYFLKMISYQIIIIRDKSNLLN